MRYFLSRDTSRYTKLRNKLGIIVAVMRFGAIFAQRSLKSRTRKFALYKQESDIHQSYYSQFAFPQGG
jgi:hypothetical protein